MDEYSDKFNSIGSDNRKPNKHKKIMTKISAQTEWRIMSRMSRSSMEKNEGQISAVCGGSIALRSWEILSEIHTEIHAKMLELRERQEILESIGCKVNGGF